MPASVYKKLRIFSNTKMFGSRNKTISFDEQLAHHKLIVGMVGLPARGKSYTSKKIVRYLSWIGLQAKVFNIGDYRRQVAGKECTADFFDP
jgi:hypothetical protein